MRLSRETRRRIKGHLSVLYESSLKPEFVQRYLDLVEKQCCAKSERTLKWNERDVVLITYGDSIRKKGEKPLATLNFFLRERLNEISIVHILPFFPYSSDDGFSIIDYEQVDPQLGNWDDIQAIGEQFDLQIDLVINHISQKSLWFRNYLNGTLPGADFFIEADPKADLSAVVRPRSLPLLTRFETTRGERWLWTTFSEDQIDLNFANPEVLFEMTRILLGYIARGVRIIRLDAIAFLWKEIGTTCLHLPQTHEVVKLFRTICDAIDPRLILLTETNVPNEENLSYFGNNDEAHMVYQFSLPPLLLHALHTGYAGHLTSWAQQLPDLPPENTFFNFTASHDGIGVRPLEGLLQKEEIDQLCENMKTFGGRISSKTNTDGTTSPYELNISLFDAFKGTAEGEDDWQEQRFLCSQTIMLAMRGVPAFYIHSLLATPNDEEGVRRTAAYRSINRHKWNAEELYQLLDRDTVHSRVFNELRRLIRIRQNQSLFHPDVGQEIFSCTPDCFIICRYDSRPTRLCSVSNITSKPVTLDLSAHLQCGQHPCVDLISGRTLQKAVLHLSPYQTLWLKYLQS